MNVQIAQFQQVGISFWITEEKAQRIRSVIGRALNAQNENTIHSCVELIKIHHKKRIVFTLNALLKTA